MRRRLLVQRDDFVARSQDSDRWQREYWNGRVAGHGKRGDVACVEARTGRDERGPCLRLGPALIDELTRLGGLIDTDAACVQAYSMLYHHDRVRTGWQRRA